MSKPTQYSKGDCPACKENISAYKTIVGDVELLCQKHKDELDGKLTEIIAAHPEDDDNLWDSESR